MVIVAKGLKEQVAPGLTPRSVTRLRQLAKRMRRVKAEKFDMSNWFTRHRSITGGWCGTAACLAGHTVLMLGKKPVFARGAQEGWLCRNGRERTVAAVAQEWLGLTSEQAEQLFHTNKWPRVVDVEFWSNRMFDTTSPKSAADRIDFFIREGR